MPQDQAATPLLSLEDVTLHAQGQVFTRHLSWTIRHGEMWAILGPTGAGKSLLATTIAAMMPLIGGSINYHFLEERASEERPLDPAKVRSQIAYVAFNERPGGAALFHQARWHASLETTSPTVDCYLSAAGIWKRNPYEVTTELPLTPPGFEATRERVIAQLEIDELLGRRLHYLSDGEWRRVQIARALLKAPALLILDDPFTGLDRHFRARIRHLISSLMQGDVEILIVTSDASEIPDSVTHVLAMKQGKITAQGPRDTILASAPVEDSGVQTRSTHEQHEQESAEPLRVIWMHDVRVAHNGTAILQNINWTVRQGERWVLLGPNGAGKTTLLSLILGDHPQAYANQIELFGHLRGSGESIWEIKRRIGWVAPELHRYYPPQSTALDVVCSGFFDTLGLYRRASAQQEAEADAWMSRLGMVEDGDRAFRALSKGEQRLALIARALVKDPELMILDEPCQGLDAEHQARVLSAIDDIAEGSARTMIYVTHRPSEFPRSLTHILELRNGQIVRQAPL